MSDAWLKLLVGLTLSWLSVWEGREVGREGEWQHSKVERERERERKSRKANTDEHCAHSHTKTAVGQPSVRPN